MYYGALQTSGEPLSFRRLLDKYYDGEILGLLITSTWGGREDRDTDIMEDIGMSYRSFRCDVDGDKKKFFILRDGRWRENDNVNYIKSFYSHMQKNEQLINEINSKLFARMAGGVFHSGSIVTQLDHISDVALGGSVGSYFHGASATCDICKCILLDEKYMIDGALSHHDGWACMCPECFETEGKGVAWGVGQLYLNEDGRWLLVGGFPPKKGAE
jgi:hypothetical protein